MDLQNPAHFEPLAGQFDRILWRKHFEKLQLKLFDSLVWLWRLVDPFLPWPGLSLIVVAQKPPAERVPGTST